MHLVGNLNDVPVLVYIVDNPSLTVYNVDMTTDTDLITCLHCSETVRPRPDGGWWHITLDGEPCEPFNFNRTPGSDDLHQAEGRTTYRCESCKSDDFPIDGRTFSSEQAAAAHENAYHDGAQTCWPVARHG